MRILLSNDDGYLAAGMSALAEALKDLAEIVVVAPERNRSGAQCTQLLRPAFEQRGALHEIDNAETG